MDGRAARTHTPNARSGPGLPLQQHPPSCCGRGVGPRGQKGGREFHRPRRRRKRSGGASSSVRILFWNARGVVDDVDELIDYMESKDISAAGICETKVFGVDLSRRGWTWLRGPETLPYLGKTLPRMGLGFLVRDNVLKGASVVSAGKYSMWIKIPGADEVLYAGVGYAPVYPKQKFEAISELLRGAHHFAKEGVVVCGGDFNARLGCNGDVTTNAAGRWFENECGKNLISILNLRGDFAGNYSRTQIVRVKRNGRYVEEERKSTIDYLLCPSARENVVLGCGIMEDAHLHSDHKPLMAQVLWRVHGSSASSGTARQFFEKWKIAETSPEGWDMFEDCCEAHLAQWSASFRARAQEVVSAVSASELWTQWLAAFNLAALEAVGKKRVCKGSVKWFDAQLEALFDLRRDAAKALQEARGAAVQGAKEKLAATKSMVRKAIKKKRLNRPC